MRKKEPSKTVEFANLSENHKAEFIQFLIKNNICFQEGKENCTARVSLKTPKNNETTVTAKQNIKQPLDRSQHHQPQPQQQQQQRRKPDRPMQNRNDILNR